MISAAVSTTRNFTTNTCFNSNDDLRILNAFSIDLHFSKAPRIKEVIWMHPIVKWMKANSDGAALGNSGRSACGGIFRGWNADAYGCFSVNLGSSSSVFA